jgi:hypothetical protein
MRRGGNKINKAGEKQIKGTTNKGIKKAMNGQSKQGSGFGGLEVACWPLVPKYAD